MNSIMRNDIENIADSGCFSSFDKETIMVTGATGLVGSMFVKSVLRYNQKYNHSVHVLAMVRNLEKASRLYTDYEKEECLDVIEWDINCSLQYDGNIDYIVHGASITASKSFVEYPVETVKTAVQGSINVLEVAKEKNVKGIVYLSSVEVYGGFENDGVKRISETDYGYIDFLKTRSSYSESKKMVENIFFSYFSEYEVKTKIARLTQTFGSGVAYNDSRVFAEFARCAVEGKDIVLHTKGETVRNYCYIIDAITAIATILVHGELGCAYNVAGDNTVVSIYEMANRFVKYSNHDISVKIQNDINEGMGYNPIVKIELVNELIKTLGWTSQCDIDMAIKNFLEYMREIGEEFDK